MKAQEISMNALIELNNLLAACDTDTIEDYYCSIADVYGNGDTTKAKQMFSDLAEQQQNECVEFLTCHMWYDVLDYDQLGDFDNFINDLTKTN